MRRATPCKLPECCVGGDVHARLRAGRESTERVPRGRESARSKSRRRPGIAKRIIKQGEEGEKEKDLE